MATTKHKAVSTITVTGVTLPIVSAPIGPSRSVETDTLGAYGDQTFTQLGRGIVSLSDLTITALFEGSALGVKAGDVVSVTITPSFDNGSGTATTAAFTESVTIKSIEYPTIEVDGSRVGAVTLVLAPVGGYDITPAQSSGTGGNGG